MGQTLTNGIYLPDEGERNSYSGLEANWRTLDALILTVNGKAAPNVANTWTAAQTFTAGIAGDLTGNVTGNLTGTASRAGADEDGNTISSTYGKLAGNNTWTGNNTFNSIKSTGVIRVEKSSGDTEFEIVNGEVDATTNTLSRQDDIRFYDKNTKITGGLRLTYTTDTGTKIELYARSWKADGTASYNRSLTIYTNGQTGEYYTTLETNFRPKTTGVYSLGASSYQWSSVYAQTYYYNGTEFQSKFVTTDTDQTITSTKTISKYNARINLNNTSITRGVIPSSNTTSQYYFGDSTGVELGRVMYRALSDGTRQMWLAINDNYASGTLDPTGTNKWNNLLINIEPSGHRVIAFDTDDVVPNTNNATNLGTSTNRWKSVYADSYYYGTTAWGLNKANVWSNENTYTNTYLTLKQTGLEEGELPASNQTKRCRFTDKNNASLGWLQHRVTTSGDSALELLAVNKFSNGQLSTQGSEILNSVVVGLHSDGSRFLTTLGDVYPDLPTRVCNLGTSTNKWKTLNGVNPGALSLPSSSYTTIDTTNWDLTGADNSYTAPADGFLFCGSNTCTDIKIYDFTTSLGSTSHSSTSRANYVYLPVCKNDVCIVGFTGSSLSARFYPCLGNV